MSSATKIKTAFTFYNKAELIRGGRSYFSTLHDMIDNASKSIQLQVYIFEEDDTGTEVASRLIKAANRGVKVQVLLDGYASKGLSNGFKNSMRETGIQLRFFEPIFKRGNYYFGRRLHHKIVVCDGILSLIGGINISDRYNDMPGAPAWLDWAIKVEGEVSFELFKLCNQCFSKKPEDWLVLVKQEIMNALDTNLHCPIRIRRNDWVMGRNEISASYMEMFRNARHEIIIMSSYFIPSPFFRKNIIKALKKGVKIKLILAGISDVGIAKHAERYLYRWAVRHGIEIHEYNHNVLHGKIAVADGKIVTIGSYNINDISALASIELNLDVQEIAFSGVVHEQLMKIIDNDCNRISPISIIRSYRLSERILQWICYETVRLLFNLFTFYLTKKRNAK
ncbi:MAG: phospholipase D-like domain-containing protein [bacterium]|jgi:cardiolipin synthase|nr:phospholipase D-like domain-containing protein [Chitinophagaceae bacterium]